MALVTVFLVSEVAPFLLALSSDLLTLLAWDNFFLLHGRGREEGKVRRRRGLGPGGAPTMTAAQL